MSAIDNPQAGDWVSASIDGRLVLRRVLANNGGNISYHDSRWSKHRECWISTWMEWCRKYKAEDSTPAARLDEAKREIGEGGQP